MPDLIAISSVLPSIKVATDIARLVRESRFTVEKAEVKLKLAELVEKLAAARLVLASVQEVEERNRRIRELAQALEIEGKVKLEAGR